jgi:hypothetical protein
MNIFILSWNTEECARLHCDKHVRKMILESTQLLCSAMHSCGMQGVPYKPTHMNHPMAVWVRMNTAHWVYLRRLALALCAEYTYRWNKEHACEAVIRSLEVPPLERRRAFCKPPLLVPDDCKRYSVPKSYRLYYLNYKQHLLQWTKRERPTWAVNTETH